MTDTDITDTDITKEKPFFQLMFFWNLLSQCLLYSQATKII